MEPTHAACGFTPTVKTMVKKKMLWLVGAILFVINLDPSISQGKAVSKQKWPWA